MDEILHHAEGEYPGDVAAKLKVRNLTEREMRELIEKHIAGWPKSKGFFGWLTHLWWKVAPYKRNRLRLMSLDNKDRSGFDLRISLEISSRATLHAKLFMLTAKWLLENFVVNASKHNAATLGLMESMPFLMITKDNDNV